MLSISTSNEDKKKVLAWQFYFIMTSNPFLLGKGNALSKLILDYIIISVGCWITRGLVVDCSKLLF